MLSHVNAQVVKKQFISYHADNYSHDKKRNVARDHNSNRERDVAQ